MISFKRFILYRKNPPHNYLEDGYAAPLGEPQLEGVVFTDGKVAIRWRTPTASISIWDSFNDFLIIHGHPEYASDIVWLDKE